MVNGKVYQYFFRSGKEITGLKLTVVRNDRNGYYGYISHQVSHHNIISSNNNNVIAVIIEYCQKTETYYRDYFLRQN